MASHPTVLCDMLSVSSVSFALMTAAAFLLFSNLVALHCVAAGIHPLACWKTLRLFLSFLNLQIALHLTFSYVSLLARVRDSPIKKEACGL